MKNKVVIYQGERGAEVRVRLDEDEVWLNRRQIAELFGRDVKTIGKHINNALTEELREFSVVAKFATTASDGKTYQVEYYNLDMILSVGYRVKSSEGVRFRIWANNVLKRYVTEGVAINERRVKELDAEKLQGLERTLGVVRRLIEGQELQGEEAQGVLEVISKYASSWELLEKYDEGKIVFPRIGGRGEFQFSYDYCLELVEKLKASVKGGELFGKKRDGSFEGAVGAIYQTFGGKELYRTVAEKAANLLYMVVKDHPFYDGNKRIGAFLFIMFLTKNGLNLTEAGECKITDRALTAITLMIAESRPEEKDLITAMVGKLLEG